jgi:hypothetical protein
VPETSGFRRRKRELRQRARQALSPRASGIRVQETAGFFNSGNSNTGFGNSAAMNTGASNAGTRNIGSGGALTQTT